MHLEHNKLENPLTWGGTGNEYFTVELNQSPKSLNISFLCCKTRNWSVCLSRVCEVQTPMSQTKPKQNQVLPPASCFPFSSFPLRFYFYKSTIFFHFYLKYFLRLPKLCCHIHAINSCLYFIYMHLKFISLIPFSFFFFHLKFFFLKDLRRVRIRV